MEPGPPKEVTIQECKNGFLVRKQEGRFVFKTIDEVAEDLLTYYKTKTLKERVS